MNCHELYVDLVSFHFGVASNDTRRGVELHLAQCSDCLQAYFAIKRDIESAAMDPPPSEQVRLRLRRSIAHELGLDRQPRGWSWWERPLAFGLSCAAVLAAIHVVGALGSSEGSAPHGWRADAPTRQLAPAP
jgi:anti-sigma factor RsiW